MFAKLFVAATVLAVSAQTVLAATCTRSYTIQEGDYCDKISQAQNVSTYQLAAMNANSIDSKCSNLIPGQTLCLANNAAEDCTTTYVVVPDDTCDGIASKNGVNTTMLLLNNPQINEGCTNIYTGEVLCSAKQVQVAPIPASGVTVAAPGTTITVQPTTTAAVVATPTAPAASASATAADDGDCDGNDSAAPADASDDDSDCDDNSTIASAAATASTAAATATATATDDGDDDDDLPFCDEL